MGLGVGAFQKKVEKLRGNDAIINSRLSMSVVQALREKGGYLKIYLTTLVYSYIYIMHVVL